MDKSEDRYQKLIDAEKRIKSKYPLWNIKHNKPVRLTNISVLEALRTRTQIELENYA